MVKINWQIYFLLCHLNITLLSHPSCATFLFIYKSLHQKKIYPHLRKFSAALGRKLHLLDLHEWCSIVIYCCEISLFLLQHFAYSAGFSILKKQNKCIPEAFNSKNVLWTLCISDFSTSLLAKGCAIQPRFYERLSWCWAIHVSNHCIASLVLHALIILIIWWYVFRPLVMLVVLLCGTETTLQHSLYIISSWSKSLTLNPLWVISSSPSTVSVIWFFNISVFLHCVISLD